MDVTLTVRNQHMAVCYKVYLRYGTTVEQAKAAIGLPEHVLLCNKFGQVVPNSLSIRGNTELKINA